MLLRSPAMTIDRKCLIEIRRGPQSPWDQQVRWIADHLQVVGSSDRFLSLVKVSNGWDCVISDLQEGPFVLVTHGHVDGVAWVKVEAVLDVRSMIWGSVLLHDWSIWAFDHIESPQIGLIRLAHSYSYVSVIIAKDKSCDVGETWIKIDWPLENWGTADELKISLCTIRG